MSRSVSSRIDEMLEEVETYLEEVLPAIDEPANHRKLAVSSLKLKDVEKLLKISQDPEPPTWCFVRNDIILSPEYGTRMPSFLYKSTKHTLTAFIASIIEYEHQESHRQSIHNEAHVRLTLN